MPAETFARRLADAITRPGAPRTVRLGAGAGALRFLELLPGALRYRLLARAFGLTKLPRAGR